LPCPRSPLDKLLFSSQQNNLYDSQLLTKYYLFLFKYGEERGELEQDKTQNGRATQTTAPNQPEDGAKISNLKRLCLHVNIAK
jgi:hypothetical protein